MDAIKMEAVGKYKGDRNGSAKGSAWRNMLEQDMDDVAFLADTEKGREAREDQPGAVAVCSQRRALCLAGVVFTAMFISALLVAYAGPHPDCPCLGEASLIPGQAPTSTTDDANRERISTSGAVFPWRSSRLPSYIIPRHYSLWLHPNLTTGDLKGEVSIDFRVDRETSFVIINARDMNITEKALFKGAGNFGPKILKTLEYLPADQTYIEFKDKLRRRHNYTLSLRFTTKLERNEKNRGFYLVGTHKNRAAVSRFWLTHARTAFPCFDEPHFKATFRLTIVRDRFHVSLTNMPIVATEEAGFYLGHRLLQDEFEESPPMSPYMVAMTVCSLQRRTGPRIEPVTAPAEYLTINTTSASVTVTTPVEEQQRVPEVSLYSDQQIILDEAGSLLDWVGRTLQEYSYELNTSYPLPKLDIVVIEGSTSYTEGWGLISIPPSAFYDTATLTRLLAQQWFGGLISPRWWSSQWLMEALTSVLSEKAPDYGNTKNRRTREREEDALLLEHMLPALRLDSTLESRAVATQKLERADIESTTDELSIHKGAAIVSMAVRGTGRASLFTLLHQHAYASADAADLWRALRGNRHDDITAWETWAEQPGYPLVTVRREGPDLLLKQERFVMKASPPDASVKLNNHLYIQSLRDDMEKLIIEPENNTEFLDYDMNVTSSSQVPSTSSTTTTKRPKSRSNTPSPKWIIPLTFIVGPIRPDDEVTEQPTVTLPTTGDINYNQSWYEVSSNKSSKVWTVNSTHLVWMNESEIRIEGAGRASWIRLNAGARGLYRVRCEPCACEHCERRNSSRGYTAPQATSAAERALRLDDAFVLASARLMPASRALQMTEQIKHESHWAPWKVVLEHLSTWRNLLRLTSVGPQFNTYLSMIHPNIRLYNDKEISENPTEVIWLSGALLTSGVSWGNHEAINQAYKLYQNWRARNITIPELYQQAAFTAGIMKEGRQAWEIIWKSYIDSATSAKPVLNHLAVLKALTSTDDDWLFFRFAWSVSSIENEQLVGGTSSWSDMCIALAHGVCTSRVSEVWRTMTSDILVHVASCITQPIDYFQIKERYHNLTQLPRILDQIALNIAWLQEAEPDLMDYFNTKNYG